MDFLMPFLIIISVGIIAVLMFNLIKTLFVGDNPKSAYLHIVGGSAEMKAWGTEQYFNLNSDVLVLQGDEIRSSADAQLIVEFFDGTIMRMGGNTVVTFTAIIDQDGEQSLKLHLKEGSLWFNKLYNNTKSTNVLINTDNLIVHSNQASVFEISDANKQQELRVIGVIDHDGLLVDILAEGSDKVVETESLSIGQEIVFSPQVLAKYWQYQSPSVISAVSDEFKKTQWYSWNTLEDSQPTEFEKSSGMENVGLVKVKPEVKEENVVLEPDDTEVKEDASIETSSETVVSVSSLSKPTITSVAGGTQLDENGFYKVSGSLATLTGSASGATKVVVNGYTLQKFVGGSGNWTYFANADYGLMKEGENIYAIYSEDVEGKKSDTLTVKVLYVPVPDPAPETVPAPENTTSGDSSAEAIIDAPVQ